MHEGLPLDSVEGYIAHKVHGVQEGETAFGHGFVICAVLDGYRYVKMREATSILIQSLWVS